MQRTFNFRSLNVKLNAILLLIFVVLFIAITFIVNSVFETLVGEVGEDQADQEAQLVQQHFADMEASILNAGHQVSLATGIASLIETGDINQLRVLILLQAAPLEIENIVVFNRLNERLLTIAEDAAHTDEQEAEIAAVALTGSATTGFAIHDDEAVLQAAVPVKNTAGQVIATILVARHIDEAFMTELNFAREHVHLAFVVDGKLMARDSSKPEEFDDFEITSAIADRMRRGEVINLGSPREDADTTPDAVAYVPLRVADELHGYVVALIELDTVLNAQSSLSRSSLALVSVLGLVALGLGALSTHWMVLTPIRKVKEASRKMADGQLSERVALHSQDEIGDLSRTFNSMAEQLQTSFANLEKEIAETQKAREAAERSDQVKSAFLASMSHELRTPLNSVINFTKFVVKGMMGPVTDEQVQTLNEVIDSAKHLLNLINDVLDMSKIESGSLRLFVEDNVNIQAVLDQVVSTGKSLIVDRPVQITTTIDGTLPSIRGDRQRLLQILLNIMSNACKFTEQGQISVRAAQHNGSISISIQDSGPGIAPEDQGLVFEPFKQTRTGLRQGGGTGLGMPISKNLTEAHGGKMWLESTPGQGATFFVELPIQSAILTPVQVEGKS
ncbi:MAG: HAMP domain-containing protein [Anaerolineae bacterium]|nr:HAMP domain-containing protein [Anaerolineae bacterium]